MKYPRLDKSKYNKKILLESEIKEIQEFFKKTNNIRLTARTFDISRHTVKYHTIPGFKEKENAESNQRHYEKYHSDENYKKTFKERVKINQRALRLKNPLITKYKTARNSERWQSDPDYKQKRIAMNTKMYKKNKLRIMDLYWSKKTKEQMMKAYLQHKESIDYMLKKEPLLILLK